MAKHIPLAIVFTIVLGSGTYLHGIYSDRWEPQNSELLNDFTQRIPQLPQNIGDWKGDDQKIPDKEFKLTKCTDYVSRRYVNEKTGQIISLYAVSGSARNCTIHSPDWCYPGAGFKMIDKVSQTVIDCGNGLNPQFLTAVFEKSGEAGASPQGAQRIFWTYSYDGVWKGPKWAKGYFSNKTALYKIYIIAPVTGTDTSISASNGVDFAKTGFPTIQKVLFPPNATEGSDS